MRSLVSVLMVAAISLGLYFYVLKRAAPEPGTVATQAISTTGVEMDLLSIAQAERVYFAQNGSYADLNTLVSSGAMNMTRSGRDGYTYSVEASGAGFTVTARHADTSVAPTNGAVPLHYPAFFIDQSMQVRRGD
jgi:hypothetical protein